MTEPSPTELFFPAQTTLIQGTAHGISPVTRDLHDRIIVVSYPSGKKRQFGWDENGNLIAVLTVESNVERKFYRQNAVWFHELEGMLLSLPGEIRLMDNGDYWLQLSPDGLWRIDTVDGGTHKRREHLTGSVSKLNTDGQVDAITRSDGSRIEGRYIDGQLTEVTDTTCNGISRRWALEQERWISPDDSLILSDLFLEENGNSIFHESSGRRRIVRGNGAVVSDEISQPQYEFDLAGRIRQIRYPDGMKIRTFKYAEGSENLLEVTVFDAQKQTSKVYSRSGPDQWTISDCAGKKLGQWQGQVVLSPDGVYSVKPAKSNQSKDSWKSWKK